MDSTLVRITLGRPPAGVGVAGNPGGIEQARAAVARIIQRRLRRTAPLSRWARRLKPTLLAPPTSFQIHQRSWGQTPDTSLCPSPTRSNREGVSSMDSRHWLFS